MRQLFIIALCILSAWVGRASGNVEIKPNGDSRHVQADGYTADVAGDGALSSVVYKGQELLKPGLGVSRGAYCFANGVLALNKIEQPDGVTIIAKADGKPAVTYAFEATAINITVANATQTPVQFIFVLDPAFNVVGDGGEHLVKMPVKRPWADTTWYAGDKQVHITGGSGLWGPYLENTNVVHADIAAGETRKITVQPADIAPTEASRVADVRQDKFFERDLTVDSPKPWQVFQRQTKDAGIVRVSGRVKPSADAVEVHIAGKSMSGDLPDKWQAASLDQASHLFNAQFETPAGGWYTVEIRVKNGDKEVATTEIRNVGVGEVFVIAGQSNSTNSGEKHLQPASGMASSFDGLVWQPANDPQPGVHDNSNGGSPWPAFADAMVEHYHVPIGIASTGHGGTSVKNWMPDGELFHHTLLRIDQLGYQGFRAVLWHQGETDTAMPSDDYFARLATVIAASRQAAGWDFPWFVAQVSYLSPKEPTFKNPRDAQQRLWDQSLALPGPDTDTLTGDNRDRGGTGIHLSEKGLRAHGKMWQEKVSAWLDKTLEQGTRAKAQ